MASLATSGGGAHGDSSFDKWIHSDTAGAEARVAFSQTGSRATTRVTNDVGAFLRNHANGRAQGTNDGSVSSTHCVSPLFTSNNTPHQVTSCCSAAKWRNLANGRQPVSKTICPGGT